MTKPPSNAELRTWARENNLAVSDRGRIPARVHAAWKAQGPKPVAAPRRRPAKVAEPAVGQSPAPGPKAGSQNEASSLGLASLRSELAALADRVRQLEKASPGGKPAKVKGKKAKQAKP